MRLTLFGPVVILTRAEDGALLFSRKENCCNMGDGSLHAANTNMDSSTAFPRPTQLTKEIFCVPAYGLQLLSHVGFDFFFDAALLCLDQSMHSAFILGHSRWYRYFNSSTVRETRCKRSWGRVTLLNAMIFSYTQWRWT